MTARASVFALAFLFGCGSDAGGVLNDLGDDRFTLVILPDTQIYARSYPAIFEAQARWIEEQIEELQIIAVLHVGDIVDDNSEAQWTVARDALGPLVGRVPLILVPGNHDYGAGGSADDRSTRLHDFFPVTEPQADPSFGGLRDPRRLDNSYWVFDTPEGPWLVLALEFGVRDPVLAWAEEILSRHPGMPTTLLTHAYLYSDDTRYDWAGKAREQFWNPNSYGLASIEPVNDGESIFNKLVWRHDQIDFVFCGHVLNDGVGRTVSSQEGGDVVHEILANYQMNDNGGDGFLRLVEFHKDSPEVNVRTYSPWLDEFKEDPDNQFVLMR